MENVELYKENICNIALLKDKKTIEVYFTESRCFYANEFKTQSIGIDLFHGFDKEEIENDSEFCLRTFLEEGLYLDETISDCISILIYSLNNNQ